MSALNQPYIVIDNEVVKYEANSVVVKDGSGEVNTRANQEGGGKTSAEHTPNGETMFSTITVSLLSTTESKELKDKLSLKKKTGEKVVVQVIEGESTDVYENCMLVNHAETGYGQDGKIDLEITGDPVI